MAKPVVDVHVYFGAPGDPDAGDHCYWSKEFEKSVAFLAFRLVSGTWLTRLDFEKAKKHLVRLVEKSDEVGPCVLLAMDMVYDRTGERRLDLTHLYVSNEAVAGIVKERPDLFLFGASVHPFRPDWEDELDRCTARGAVLCKWIPSSQQIDLSDPRCERFYAKLAKLNLPLLCHAGPENAIPTSDHFYDQFNNPKYLATALQQGTTVIVPHCVLSFPPQDLATFEPHQEPLKLLREADEKDWPLYVDLSALLLFRNRYIPDVLKNIPAKRILLGSDYPIPMPDLAYKTKLYPWTGRGGSCGRCSSPISWTRTSTSSRTWALTLEYLKTRMSYS